MGRKKKKKIVCRYCKATFETIDDLHIEKTWHVVSPMPDKKGNITINVMAVWICPNCGRKNRGKLISIKSGEELRGKNYTELLIEKIQQRKKISLDELSEEMRIDKQTLFKAVNYLIKKKIINAKITNETIELC